MQIKVIVDKQHYYYSNINMPLRKGIGTLVEKNGKEYILTSKHVIGNAESATCVINNKNTHCKVASFHSSVILLVPELPFEVEFKKDYLDKYIFNEPVWIKGNSYNNIADYIYYCEKSSILVKKKYKKGESGTPVYDANNKIIGVISSNLGKITIVDII